MTEIAWQRYIKIGKEHQNEAARRWYHMNAKYAADYAKKWRHENKALFNARRRESAHRKGGWPKRDPDYVFFRHVIRSLDEYGYVWQMFERERRKDKLKGLPFQTHLTLTELKDQPPIEPVQPFELQVVEPMVSGSEIYGGIQQLWRKHPLKYRERHLKFARLDMT